MMKRREFAQKLGGAAIGIALVGPAQASGQLVTPRKNTLTHVGGDYFDPGGKLRGLIRGNRALLIRLFTKPGEGLFWS